MSCLYHPPLSSVKLQPEQRFNQDKWERLCGCTGPLTLMNTITQINCFSLCGHVKTIHILPIIVFNHNLQIWVPVNQAEQPRRSRNTHLNNIVIIRLVNFGGSQIFAFRRTHPYMLKMFKLEQTQSSSQSFMTNYWMYRENTNELISVWLVCFMFGVS